MVEYLKNLILLLGVLSLTLTPSLAVGKRGLEGGHDSPPPSKKVNIDIPNNSEAQQSNGDVMDIDDNINALANISTLSLNEKLTNINKTNNILQQVRRRINETEMKDERALKTLVDIYFERWACLELVSKEEAEKDWKIFWTLVQSGNQRAVICYLLHAHFSKEDPLSSLFNGALAWLQKAASQEMQEGVYSNIFGYILLNAQDDECKKWLIKSYELGNVVAARSLGFLYEKGIPGKLEADINKAIEYYHSAAKEGLIEVAVKLGALYYRGIPGKLEADINKAIEYYDIAARRGHVKAANILGNLYIQGIPGKLEADINKAIEYYRIAADRGDLGAAMALGILYHRGVPGKLEPNPQEAIKYYELAPTQAANGLANLYCMGIPGKLEPDYMKAFEVCFKAGRGDGLLDLFLDHPEAFLRQHVEVVFKLIKPFHYLNPFVDSPKNNFLLWEFFKDRGHSLEKRLLMNFLNKEVRDLNLLIRLHKAANNNNLLAQRAWNKLTQFSSLEGLEPYPHAASYSPFDAPLVGDGMLATSPEGIVEQKFRSLAATTEDEANSFILPCALATVMKDELVLTSEDEPELGDLIISAQPAPEKLSLVYKHVFASMRLKQIQEAQQGKKLFVNLSTLEHDPWLSYYFVPLDENYPNLTEEEWAVLKKNLKELSLEENHQNLEIFFNHIEELEEEDNGRSFKRVNRIYEALKEKDVPTQQSMIWALATQGGESCSQRALRAVTQVEVALLSDKTYGEDIELPVLISQGLALKRLELAYALARRKDHTGVVEEERYYELIFSGAFSLPLDEASLEYPEAAFQCLRPKHAMVSFLEGENGDDGYLSPHIPVDTVHSLIKEKKTLVLEWFEKNPDEELKNALMNQPKENHGRIVYDHFATEDYTEVRKDFIPRLLTHPSLKYLSETPFYD